MHALLVELERRWESMFNALRAGDDVPPAQRLRAEGLMEAVQLLEVATPQEVQGAMADCYQKAFGYPVEEALGEEWQAFFPFPQIPAMMHRAPVYPSTTD